MQTTRLATRSVLASCLLHLAALSGLAAWSALANPTRPRFAGQSEVIELLVTRVETTSLTAPVTLDDPTLDDVRITIEPLTARVARKQFDQINATEFSFEALLEETDLQASPSELERAATARLNSPVSLPEIAPLPSSKVPRQRPELQALQAVVVQLPQRLGTDRIAPSFTTSPPPNYPTVALQNRWEGTVLLRVSINADGVVDKVEVARSSGHPVLDGAAVNAVTRWRGTPARRDGVAIATTELLPVRFKLRD